MRIAVLTGAALALAACTTAAAEEDAPAVPIRVAPEGACDASGLQDHIGHTATAESGAILLRESGARTLRWIPPDSAVTMDYRPDRLNVGYDRDMKITRISCG